MSLTITQHVTPMIMSRYKYNIITPIQINDFILPQGDNFKAVTSKVLSVFTEKNTISDGTIFAKKKPLIADMELQIDWVIDTGVVNLFTLQRMINVEEVTIYAQSVDTNNTKNYYMQVFKPLSLITIDENLGSMKAEIRTNFKAIKPWWLKITPASINETIFPITFDSLGAIDIEDLPIDFFVDDINLTTYNENDILVDGTTFVSTFENIGTYKCIDYTLKFDVVKGNKYSFGDIEFTATKSRQATYENRTRTFDAGTVTGQQAIVSTLPNHNLTNLTLKGYSTYI